MACAIPDRTIGSFLRSIRMAARAGKTDGSAIAPKEIDAHLRKSPLFRGFRTMLISAGTARRSRCPPRAATALIRTVSWVSLIASISGATARLSRRSERHEAAKDRTSASQSFKALINGIVARWSWHPCKATAAVLRVCESPFCKRARIASNARGSLNSRKQKIAACCRDFGDCFVAAIQA